MGTVIGLWTFMYGFGAMPANRVSGVIRDSSGSYDRAFLIDALMAGLGLLLISFVKKREVGGLGAEAVSKIEK